MLTPALNDPLIEQSTHFPLRMPNLLTTTPPPTTNQSNLRFAPKLCLLRSLLRTTCSLRLGYDLTI